VHDRLADRRRVAGLLSLRVTRDSRFRFTPGHYARLGLPAPSGPTIFRPLSITSAPADAHLEFFCTLVAGGDFSRRLDDCRVGDPVEVEKASYGFLTLDALAPGSDLWLIASGSGLGPYLSMLRDAGVWAAFSRIVVVHSVRRAAELAYAEELERLARESKAATAAARLQYLPVVTREPGVTHLSQRIPALLADGSVTTAAGVDLDPEHSRVMVCGNPEMSRELRALFSERGFRTTRRGVLGEMAFEKYW
jgi:ferredoxin--NADP+ reductase